MTLNVTGLVVEFSCPVLEVLIERLIRQIKETGDKLSATLTDSEQKLTDALTGAKTAIADLEIRVVKAEGTLTTANALLTDTNTALNQTIATLQAQLANGNVGGAGSPVVTQVISDLNDLVTSANAFQADNPSPAPPPVPTPVPTQPAA